MKARKLFLLSLILILPGLASGDDAFSITSGRVSRAADVSGRATVSRGTTGASRAIGGRASVSRSGGESGVVSRRGVVSGVSAARVAATPATVTPSTTTTTISGNSGRVGMRAASSTSRSPSLTSVSVSNKTTTSVSESIKDVTANLTSLSELADYCKEQYTQCMDNFCNVLDDNQGRCSCSRNVKNYEKTEEALRTATEELQDVAQRIQYIGLTGEEINMLFTQTEAELAMQNTADNSKIKNDLDRIKNMIVGVKSGSSGAAVTDTAGISLDFSNLLSFNIDSYGFDLSGLFGTTTTQNTQSIGNQRGEALYKSAAARCKQAVLANCSAQGVDSAVIINAYDMEIDRQCIIYERALIDSNNQMVATVRNAKTVLQKARLMLAQQKNQYDLKGCVSALDSCMQDDYVCGTDYEECLDPTGKYIVEGQVVVGSMPGEAGGEWAENKTSAANGLYTVWNETGQSGGRNIWGPSASNPFTIANYISGSLKLENAKATAPKDISQFLQTKIGYHDNTSGRNYGMCMSVLNKCQDFTYDKNGKYIANNQIISEYMQRAFRQIKTSQDRILSNYATNCLSDVTSCLSQNNYSFATSASANPSNIAIRACLPVINTCRSVTLGLTEASVDITDLSEIYTWLDAGIATTFRTTCENSGGSWNGATGVCTCTGLANSSQDAAKRMCVCNSGYTYQLNEAGTAYICASTGS